MARLALRLFSLLLIMAAATLAYQEWEKFQAAQAFYPPGSTLAGVPVGGLDRQEAVQRLEAAYAVPVELRYQEDTIYLSPEAAGFTLDIDRILPSGPQAGEKAPALPGFRDYLWNRPAAPVHAPLEYSLSEDKLRLSLEDIAARYDASPIPARPAPASINFQPGVSGREMDIDATIQMVQAVLPSISRPPVDLPTRVVAPPRPDFQNLEILLQQIVDVSGLNSLVDVYLADLQTGEQVHLAMRPGENLSTRPDIAFSGSSIIKIPILVSAFRRMEGSPSEMVDGWLNAMFSQSSNEAADALMKNVIDPVRGPLVVTEDLHALGLENTFLAGFFEFGSPLLQIFDTPANTRRDVDTAPDIYNQATPSDIGVLLKEIFQCAHSGSGLLLETFPDEITQEECRLMIEYMEKDREPYMLVAALPEGTQAARKHGYYGSSAGLNTTIGDAGIVFTPVGDFVLVIYLNNPELLLFDPANQLMARMALAVYNYYNLQ
jgi:hypothetical protein